MRYTGPKNKISRRHGKDVYGNNKSNLEKRLGQAPGQHGNSRKRETSYATQLKEKQYVKRVYGLTEKQFKSLYLRSRKRSDLPVGEAIVQSLERRLDNVVYRLGIAKTRPQARQFVVNKKILVNGVPVYAPSYSVSPGDQITMVSDFINNPHVISNLKDTSVLPEWLSVKGTVATIDRNPSREDVGEDIQEDMVIAFYSR